jgi:tRNA(Ile)-lysidine synthase TilS/MesJ
LLTARRSDLIKYAQMHSLNYVEDETNQNIKFTRNRIRHELIPFLTEQFGDSVWSSLYDRAQYSAVDDSLLSEWASGFLSPIRELSFGSVAWLRGVRGALETAPEPLRWRITEQALLELVKYRLGRTKATEASLVLIGERVAVQIPGGMELRRSKGELLVQRAHEG